MIIEWKGAYLKPLWLIQHEIRIAQIDAELEAKLKFNKSVPPELMKLHTQSTCNKK